MKPSILLQNIKLFSLLKNSRSGVQPLRQTVPFTFWPKQFHCSSLDANNSALSLGNSTFLTGFGNLYQWI